MTATEIAKKYGSLLAIIPGVVFVADNLNTGEINVYVKDEETRQLLKKMISEKIEGVKVDILIDCEFKLQYPTK